MYAYVHPVRDGILYVGKAGFQTARQRLHGERKQDVFRQLWSKYRMDEVRVIQGDLELEPGPASELSATLPPRWLVEHPFAVLQLVRELAPAQEASADRLDESRVRNEDLAGAFVRVDDSDFQPELVANNTNRLEQVRIVGHQNRELVLIPEAIPNKMGR